MGRPNIGDRERLLARLTDAIDRRWLTNDGPLVTEFEARVAGLVGVKHCIAVSNATVGLQLVARATGLSGEVIVPSFTFVGTAHALSWVGVTPVFCDIDRRTHTLDPEAVQRAVTPQTSGILGVHLWGRPCEIACLQQIADEHRLALIFDAAHALACTYENLPIGSQGQAQVFSFHATKIANAAEGGVIATNDEQLAHRLRLMRSFGFSAYDTVVGLGTNAKMSELSAAMGLTSLVSLSQFISVNRLNYQTYARQLGDVEAVRLMEYSDQEHCNYHYVVIEMVAGVADGILRDDLVTVLHAENVLARRYFFPGCHRLEPYCGADFHLPATEAVADRVITLPTGTTVSQDDIETICSIIRAATCRGRAVREQLARTHAGSGSGCRTPGSILRGSSPRSGEE